jgi:hypothetical protein
VPGKSSFDADRKPFNKQTDRVVLSAPIELLTDIEKERIASAEETNRILSRHRLVGILINEALEARRQRRELLNAA